MTYVAYVAHVADVAYIWRISRMWRKLRTSNTWHIWRRLRRWRVCRIVCFDVKFASCCKVVLHMVASMLHSGLEQSWIDVGDVCQNCWANSIE
jgi:hypothetical protein